MNKWLLVAIVVAVIGFWYMSSHRKAADSVVLPDGRTVEVHTPNEAQCRQLGGRFIEGVGCVSGPVEAANQDIPPEQMAKLCESVKQRYIKELNACLAN